MLMRSLGRSKTSSAPPAVYWLVMVPIDLRIHVTASRTWRYFDVTTASDVAPRQAAAISLYAAIDPYSNNGVQAVMDGEGKPLLRC